jgi:hypothetical protein
MTFDPMRTWDDSEDAELDELMACLARVSYDIRAEEQEFDDGVTRRRLPAPIPTLEPPPVFDQAHIERQLQRQFPDYRAS